MSSVITGNILQFKITSGLPGWLAGYRPSIGSEAAELLISYSDEHCLPAYASDARYAVLFDGILQNRQDILRELGRADDITATDADVVMAAYLRWQDAIIEKLYGVFLLAVWDVQRNTLLCVRDRCGVYPLFYADTGDEFLFSTSTENLIRHPKVSSSINRSSFVDFLCHRRPLPEETFFSSVRRILPGHGVRIHNPQREFFRYFYSFPQNGVVDYITDLESSGFNETLDRAVGRCMDLGPSGIFLSGGLDSVSIASVAAVLAKRNGVPSPKAFSLGFSYPDCNEVSVQTGVAGALGLEHVLEPVDSIITGGPGLLHMALDLNSTWSQPMWNTWQPLYLHLGRKARDMGIKVIITGAGGDEWLTVSDLLTADLIRLVDIRGLNRLVRSLLRSYKLPRSSFLWHIFWKSGFRILLAEYGRAIACQIAPGQLRSWIRARLRRSTFEWVAGDPQLKQEADERVEILVEQYMQRMKPRGRYRYYSNSLAGYFVETIASMEMEQLFEAWQRMEVPILHPYFDPELIQLLLRMSPEILQKGGMEKGLVRDAVSRRFPDLKFEKQKKVTAMGYWQSILRGEGRQVWKETGGPSTLIDLGIVNGKVIGPVIDQAFESPSAFLNGKIWDLLCLEAWVRPRVD